MVRAKPTEPTEPEPTEAEHPALTEALVQATEQVLAEHGAKGVTVLRIATRAGVSLGTLLRCFRNKEALLAEAIERQGRAAPAVVPPLPPRPPARETLEEAITVLVRSLVTTFDGLLPTLSSLPQGDRDAIRRVELKNLNRGSEALLTRFGVPDPTHVAHVMTLSCDRVLRDAMQHAPESFSDGRLEQALCRLCLDFVRAEQQG